ncbi:hypothetical protein PSTG_02854 [Puccinia striiformis f. sp. tritici PST-78]|uniref:Uncharacterized protein n=1 Tax=Puccinia striiformis f. sp. tritici PST-78 TaxID=1165861 RepID=A0A0L0VXJ6_9BASI|nr:hypothetical protein PSTG_02854 [Puccinia striiformis f. sp. tritici PST-78]
MASEGSEVAVVHGYNRQRQALKHVTGGLRTPRRQATRRLKPPPCSQRSVGHSMETWEPAKVLAHTAPKDRSPDVGLVYKRRTLALAQLPFYQAPTDIRYRLELFTSNHPVITLLSFSIPKKLKNPSTHYVSLSLSSDNRTQDMMG